MADVGFKALGGTSRQYIDLSNNETISRREYYKRSGRQSFEEIKAVKVAAGAYINPMERYNKLVAQFKQSVTATMGLKPSEITVRGDTVTSNLLKQVVKGLKSKDDRATGSKAESLIFLGLREAEWTFAVGETPTEGR